MDGELVGRDRELGSIDRFLSRVAAEPGILLLEGASGIGKTTVWLEGRDRAAAAGFRVLSCRPIETETPLAFVSLGDLLEPVLDETLSSLPVPQAHALEVALFRADARGERPDQHAISAATLGIVRRLAADGPVLLCVDDLQWLDRPTARVLEFAARRIAVEPVGILAAWRSGELAPFDPKRILPVERIGLGPLSLGAVQAILRTGLGTSPSRSVLRRVHAASGGNPFYALEIGRAIRDAGGDTGVTEPLPIPAALEDMAKGRLRALPARVRRTLALVAFLALPTVGLVESASAESELAVRDHLERARRAGVIELSASGIRFTHPLLAAAAAAEPSVADRRAQHRRLAAVVESEEESARHLALATVHDDEEVARRLEAAARHAYLRGADGTAAELADWATRLTPGPSDERRSRMIMAAEYHFSDFDLAEARRLLEAVVRSLPAGPARADVLLRLAKVRINADRSDAAVDLVAQAIEEAGDDPVLSAVAHQMFAGAAWASGNIPATIPHLHAALDLAGKIGDEDLIAQISAFLAVALFVVGEGVRRDLLERAPISTVWAPHVMIELRPNVLTGHVFHWAGELDEARRRYAAELQLALARGAETDLPFLLWGMADLELRAGNWELAGTYADEARDLSSQSGGTLPAVLAAYPAALLAACRGEASRARAIASESLEIGTRHGLFVAMLFSNEVLGFLALSEGDAAGCIAVLQPLVDAMFALDITEPSQLPFVPDAMEAHVALGQLEEAERLLQRWERESERLGRVYGLATGARCRGLLLAARGDMPAAIAAMKRSLAFHDELAMPLESGRTLLVAGEVHRRAKQRREAREYFGRALKIFEGLGAPLWAAKARAGADRVGRPSPAAGDLTVTEEQVARLVVAGRTNREVAAELFISVRTVEVNLSRIYRKLGVRSRTQLARRLGADTS